MIEENKETPVVEQPKQASLSDCLKQTMDSIKANNQIEAKKNEAIEKLLSGEYQLIKKSDYQALLQKVKAS